MPDERWSAPAQFVRLNSESRFRFSCQRCGECCFDQAVRLEPQDLLWLGCEARFSPIQRGGELFARGVVRLECVQTEWSVWLSMPRWQRGTKCRFLLPRLSDAGALLGWDCDLHATGNKPFVCWMSPLARTQDDEFYFVPPTESCPGVNRGGPRSLAEYLADTEALGERLAHSRWFWQHIAPVLAGSEEKTRAAFDIDYERVKNLDDLRAWLAAWM